jgi:hypothetical protein
MTIDYASTIRPNINYTIAKFSPAKRIITFRETRTKTSIRYAKENDKEKRERRKERERKVEGERERGREGERGIERDREG